MALNDMASEGRAGGGGELEVDDRAGLKVGKSSTGDGFGGEVGGETRWECVGLNTEGGEADAADCDAVAGDQARCEGGRGDGDARGPCGWREAEDGSRGFDEAGEHKTILAAWSAKGRGDSR